MLPDCLDVKVFVTARTGFRVAQRDSDAEFFGAAASVLSHAFGIELAVTIWAFFDLIVVSAS